MVNIPVCILAGGLSRRMGREKSLMQWGGQTMLGRVIDIIGPQTPQIYLNANGDTSRFAQFQLPIIPDIMDGHLGPLAGVLTAMQAIKDTEYEHIITLACDCPFYPADLVERFAGAVDRVSGIITAQSGGQRHPVIALWHKNLATALEYDLNHNIRKIEDFTRKHQQKILEFSGNPDPFTNINTPDEWELYSKNSV